MNPRDPLNDIFKKLDHSESNDLSSKEKVWAMLEKKLDQPAKKETKEFSLNWKWLAAAAVILFAGVTYLFVKPTDKQTPIMAKTESVNVADSPVETPTPPQKIVQNDITTGQVEKIKEEKKKLNAPKDIIAYQEAYKPVIQDISPSPAISPSTGYTPPPPPATTGAGKNVELPRMRDERRETKRLSNADGTNSMNLQGKVAGLAISSENNMKEVVITGYSARAYKKVAAETGVNTISSAMGIKGSPGNMNNVIIRGVSTPSQTNNPLYVMNGEVVNNSYLKVLSPNNIESINVLKGEKATALYGSKAANGVIVITTKDLSKRELRKIKRKARKLEKENPIITLPQPKIEVSKEEYPEFTENRFESPATDPLSTFSVDVDKAAYSNIRRMINYGQTVPKDAVRIEEMINYFPYNYSQPTDQHPFSISTEYSIAPWNPKHKLLKIGLQSKNLDLNKAPKSNLVFLVDVSGSMNQENKLPLLKKSLALMTEKLSSEDKVSLVAYAGSAGLVLPTTSGSDKKKILEAIDRLSAGGSTAGGAGIQLAYKIARENLIRNGNNRVVIATDGDFNVGVSSRNDLTSLIEAERKSGIFLTCLGYGMGNYKDTTLETLAKAGNGNYAYIDNLQEANKFLVKEFAGTMYTIAKDVKIQIEFNPQNIQAYRLIGYENRLLKDEDFVNDAIDAGEIGAGHQVTALYEIIPAGTEDEFSPKNINLKYSKKTETDNNFGKELATIKFRYKKPDGDKSIEIIKNIDNKNVALSNTSDDFRFAADVAWFGMKLRDSQYLKNKETKSILNLGKSAIKYDPDGYRNEFLKLVELVK
ncbi:vWA domain-containing protein [Elizabethkingia miricola]|uniref:von Willebrand factor type A domain-containing protein n=1 Tax=Elizabethkingia miricola TaxID=172045 RepID=A0ABD5B6K8_ELIMR|nr:von Willebrand factor type A domain-containing protein [Elizabethkingia miricola]MDQ8749365.1 von Willebrand factor type A domain-containing protein [Elizabethkingia miricola]